jgi:amino acid transporter
MPSLSDIIQAPVGQALPYIYDRVMGSPGAGFALTFLVLVIALFCSISITVVTSRCTRAFARDNAIPFSSLWSKVDEKHGSPIWALTLATLVQLLLGLISLGSTSAFLAFVSVSVMALSVAYGIPIMLSIIYMRREVRTAPWKMNNAVGWVINAIAMAWITFEMVIFSMPSVIPIDEVSMNYAVVVFFGFMGLSTLWYFVYARKGQLLLIFVKVNSCGST